MKKALYAIIVAVVLIISLIAHSFCFGTGDIVADIKGVYNDIFNDGITETKTFSELKFDFPKLHWMNRSITIIIS